VEKRKSPYGILIPGRINHFPAGVVGNREYLLTLKEAIEKALDEGIGLLSPIRDRGRGSLVGCKV